MADNCNKKVFFVFSQPKYTEDGYRYVVAVKTSGMPKIYSLHRLRIMAIIYCFLANRGIYLRDR